MLCWTVVGFYGAWGSVGGPVTRGFLVPGVLWASGACHLSNYAGADSGADVSISACHFPNFVDIDPSDDAV